MWSPGHALCGAVVVVTGKVVVDVGTVVGGDTVVVAAATDTVPDEKIAEASTSFEIPSTVGVLYWTITVARL